MLKQLLTRSTLAGLVLAVPGLISSSIDASNIADLKAAVEASGTEVIERSCTAEDDKDAYGFYEYEAKDGNVITDQLVVCTNNTGNSKTAIYLETLKHEATHVAQACRGFDPVLGYTQTHLAKLVSATYEVSSIYDNYEQHQHYVELEAFYMESQSTQDVTDLVNDNCQEG